MTPDDEYEHPPEPIEGVFTDVFTAQSEPPMWIVKDLLPPGLVIIGADPKTGKTTLMMAIASIVAGFKCQALPPSMTEVPEDGIVKVFSYEATAGELRHMLEVGLGIEGEPNGSILIADDPWNWRLDDEASVKQMIEWMDQRKPKLTLLDPFRNFHAFDEKDSGIISLLAPLRRWAIKNQCCFAIVHHTKKPGEDGGREIRTKSAVDLRGSSALFGAADGVLMMTSMEPPGRVGRMRIQAIFKRAPGWERDFVLSCWDNVGKSGFEVLNDLQKLILKMATSGPITQQNVVDQLKLNSVKASENLETLGRTGFLKKDGRTWTKAVR